MNCAVRMSFKYMIIFRAQDMRSLMFHGAMCNTPNAINCHCNGCWHFIWANMITYLKSPAATLTELVADALILQQGGVFEGVPAVQDPCAPAQCSDAPQRQHCVVYEQWRRLLSEPRQNWAISAILGVTEDQYLPPIFLLAWKTHTIQTHS